MAVQKVIKGREEAAERRVRVCRSLGVRIGSKMRFWFGGVEEGKKENARVMGVVVERSLRAGRRRRVGVGRIMVVMFGCEDVVAVELEIFAVSRVDA